MIKREKEAKRLYIPRQSESDHGTTRLLNMGTNISGAHVWPSAHVAGERSSESRISGEIINR